MIDHWARPFSHIGNGAVSAKMELVLPRFFLRPGIRIVYKELRLSYIE